MNKDNIDKGKYHVARDEMNPQEDCYILYYISSPVIFDLTEDMANFIAEAFNVFSKTGMTPEELFEVSKMNANLANQLQQERDELKIMVKAFERAFECVKIAKDVSEATKMIAEYLNTPQEEKKL